MPSWRPPDRPSLPIRLGQLAGHSDLSRRGCCQVSFMASDCAIVSVVASLYEKPEGKTMKDHLQVPRCPRLRNAPHTAGFPGFEKPPSSALARQRKVPLLGEERPWRSVKVSSRYVTWSQIKSVYETVIPPLAGSGCPCLRCVPSVLPSWSHRASDPPCAGRVQLQTRRTLRATAQLTSRVAS